MRSTWRLLWSWAPIASSRTTTLLDFPQAIVEDPRGVPPRIAGPRLTQPGWLSGNTPDNHPRFGLRPAQPGSARVLHIAYLFVDSASEPCIRCARSHQARRRQHERRAGHGCRGGPHGQVTNRSGRAPCIRGPRSRTDGSGVRVERRRRRRVRLGRVGRQLAGGVASRVASTARPSPSRAWAAAPTSPAPTSAQRPGSSGPTTPTSSTASRSSTSSSRTTSRIPPWPRRRRGAWSPRSRSSPSCPTSRR